MAVSRRLVYTVSRLPMSTPNDDVLYVQAALSGDTRAFGVLVDRYQTPVYNLARRMLGNSADAEDLTQETFVLAYQNLKNLKVEQKFFSWLYAIALNQSRRCLRRQRSWLSLFDTSAQQLKLPPPDIEEKSVRTVLVEQMLNSLNPVDRSLVILRYYDDLSYEDIAATVDMPLGTVKNRLHRCREQLYRKYQSEFNHETI